MTTATNASQLDELHSTLNGQSRFSAYAEESIPIAIRTAVRPACSSLLLFAVADKIWSGRVLSYLPRNLRVIMSSAALIAVPAFGMTIIIIAAGIDLVGRNGTDAVRNRSRLAAEECRP